MKVKKFLIIPLLLALFAVGGCSASAGIDHHGAGASVGVG
jgi:hypothetical protein